MTADHGTRTPGQRVWLAGAVGLVGLLVVAGGWLTWQGLAAPGVPDAAAVRGPVDARRVPEPVELVAGLRWGLPQTIEGAAAAATVAVAVTGRPEVVFDADRFDEVAELVFTDEQAAVQARKVDAARVELELSAWADQPATRRMYHFTPLAVKPTAFDRAGPTATVQVWAMTLIGVGDAGGAVFTTSTVHLTGDGDGAWVVAGLDTVQGPTPMVAAAASPPGATRALLRDSLPVVPLPTGPRR